MNLNRIIVYPKDVQRITGKDIRYCRALLDRIRGSKNKRKDQFISVNEFAEFTGLSVDEIASYLMD